MLTTEILTFILASLVVILTPGPDILFCIQTGLNHGVKAAFWSSLGFSLGNIFHICLVLAGFSTLLKSNQTLSQIVFSLGGVYLILIGTQSIMRANSKLKEVSIRAKESFFKKSLLMNLLNPKVILFFAAFFPMFIKSKRTQFYIEYFMLGVIFILLVFFVFFSLSALISQMGLKILLRSNIKKFFNIGSGILFIGIGIKFLARNILIQ